MTVIWEGEELTGQNFQHCLANREDTALAEHPSDPTIFQLRDPKEQEFYILSNYHCHYRSLSLQRITEKKISDVYDINHLPVY